MRRTFASSLGLLAFSSLLIGTIGCGASKTVDSESFDDDVGGDEGINPSETGWEIGPADDPHATSATPNATSSVNCDPH